MAADAGGRVVFAAARHQRERPAAECGCAAPGQHGQKPRAGCRRLSNGRLYLQRWTRLRKADPAYQGKDAPFIAALKNDCRTVDRACLALLEANDKPIRETLAAQAVTLAHYRELIALTGWQAPFPLDMTNLPDAVAIGDGQRLLLLAAWLRARDGDANAVSAALAAEHRFWRMALGSTDELISKMFALAYLQRNLAWGNMVLGQLPPKAQRGSPCAMAVAGDGKGTFLVAAPGRRIPVHQADDGGYCIRQCQCQRPAAASDPGAGRALVPAAG
ncbi:hypothetical protein LP419_09180 [Massilia sp. H-1]|nr:hypothetical protein LP419_09180 [Massilia sp. H-1]